MKSVAGAEFENWPIVHGRGGSAGNDDSDVLHRAGTLADGASDVLGPAPTGLVRGATKGHAANMDDFELALRERAGFIGVLKTFEDDLGYEVRRAS